MPETGPPRVDVLGVGISAVSFDQALEEIDRLITTGAHGYVTVTGVHGVMESQRDPELLAIHNRSVMSVPDGMPMVWSSHNAGAHWVERVYGPDLMLAVFAESEMQGWRHFLYGGADGVAELLAQRLQDRFPNAAIVGTYTPPFRPLTEDEDADVIGQINGSGAEIVWVGLSTPKQERWMAEHDGRIAANLMFGVGAAFDFHAGLVPQAPSWIQKRGFEWLYRLTRDPKRLWKRYARNNPGFLIRIRRHPPSFGSTAVTK